jgi:hypothetical protein
MVKEYTVRADVTNVDLDTIPLAFKSQNTVSEKKQKTIVWCNMM